MSPLANHLFVSDSNGDLFDSRVSEWSKFPPLRAFYSHHFSKIENVSQLKAVLRAGEWTSVGCYPLYLIMEDGETMSFKYARENFAAICADMRAKPDIHVTGWRVVACEVNYEDADMVCCGSGEPIPSAYGD